VQVYILSNDVDTYFFKFFTDNFNRDQASHFNGMQTLQ
jgi:hypothetical protein